MPPHLIHGIVECVRAAQAGGAGDSTVRSVHGDAVEEEGTRWVRLPNSSPPRNNARRNVGDSITVDTFFFERQQRRVAGSDDARLYEFIADPLLWVGVKKIDKFVSTSSSTRRR